MLFLLRVPVSELVILVVVVVAVLYNTGNNFDNNNSIIQTVVALSTILPPKTTSIPPLGTGVGTSTTSTRDISPLISWSIQNNIYINTDVMQFVSCDNDTNDDDCNNDIDTDTEAVPVVVDATTGTTNPTLSSSSSSSSSSQNYGVELIKDCKAGTVLMKIPSSIILSADTIREELLVDIKNNQQQQQQQQQTDATVNEQQQELQEQNSKSLDESINIIKESGFSNHISQYYLYIKLLKEYNLQSLSKYYEWIQTLPNNSINTITATSMTQYEIEQCLPSYAYCIAKLWQYEYKIFVTAIQLLPNTIVPLSIKTNSSLLHWAFNIIFTRCWSYIDNEPICNNNNSTIDNNNIPATTTTTTTTNNISRIDLVPLGDMFNHGSDKNIDIIYDTHTFDVTVVLCNDTKAQSSLLLSYGKESNSYHYLTIFGFVDTSQKEIFSHLVPNSSTISNNICQLFQFDSSQLVFRTIDGTISNTIWNFILYTLLEQNKQLQSIFVNAYRTNDTSKIQYIHSKYHYECCQCLLQHVSRTLNEMHILLDNINIATTTNKDNNNNEYNTINQKRLSMIRQNNELVTNTFYKVQQQLLNKIKMLESN